MLIYISIYVAIILAGFYTDKEVISIKNKTIISPRVYLLTVIMILFLISALRVDIGTDYHFYHRIYNNSLEKSLKLGIGFEWFSDFFRNINVNFQLFVAFNSLIVAVSILYFVKSYSTYYYLSIITFLGTYGYFASFNIFRQFTSISLVIVALVLFNKHKNKVWGILVYIFSIGIHLSSIAYIPGFIMRYVNLGKKMYVVILFLCLFSYFCIPDSFKNFVFEELMSLNTFYFEKYKGSIYSEAESRSMMNRMFYLFYWVLIAQLILRSNKVMKDERWLVQGFLLYLLMESVLPLTNLTHRISYFFELLAIYIIPKSISTMNASYLKTIFKIAIVVIFLVRVIYVLSLNGDGVVPYKSIFD